MRFWKRQRERKLYRQWAMHSGLPPDSITQEKVVGDETITGERRDRLPPYKERLLAIAKKLLNVK